VLFFTKNTSKIEKVLLKQHFFVVAIFEKNILLFFVMFLRKMISPYTTEVTSSF